MKTPRITLATCAVIVLASCAKEPPPRTVTEFVDNPILLEAAVVRCAQNRNETRYDAECVNAREAVKRIEAKEEAARREALEASSERKRRALRRTQQAAAEARRRAAEAEKQRLEEEYLAQFGELPPDAEGGSGLESGELGNVPTAVLPPPGDEGGGSAGPGTSTVPQSGDVPQSGNAPTAEIEAEPESAGDLNSIRDELRRRSEEEEPEPGTD